MSLEGRKYVLDYFGPGQFFNLAAALNGGTNKASVEAVTDTMTLVLPCDQLYEIVRVEPGVALAAIEYLASAVSQLSDAVADLALHTVRTRLARFLLSQSCNHGRLARSWTQEDIAARIGSVRDVVGRALRSFLSEGLIRWERNRLAVADLDGLTREAGAIESRSSVRHCRKRYTRE
jgi:CRP/FNR family transcriptional regulator